jgi:hypothetical protein
MPTRRNVKFPAALACAFLLGLGACGKSTSAPTDGGGGAAGGGSRGGEAGGGTAGSSRGGSGGAANAGGVVGSGGGGGQGGVGGGGQSGGTAGSNGGGGSGAVGNGGSGGGGRSGGAAGAGGNGGSAGGSGGAGTSGRAGSGGSAGRSVDAGRDVSEPGAFVCNLVIGNSTTQQWFDGGFLTHAGIDAIHWEMYWVAHHYIDSWANPADAGWTTPLDMGHACASDSTTPDRVIFIVTFAPPYPPEATYQTDLTSIVDNIKTKYPSASRIELMTLIRAPGNSGTACSSQANNEQSIPPAEDDAIAAVAAAPAFAGVVFAVPPAYVPSCSDFIADAPQYTTAGATDIAGVYGAYYAAHP